MVFKQLFMARTVGGSGEQVERSDGGLVEAHESAEVKRVQLEATSVGAVRQQLQVRDQR